ncbi:hypothetical protein [Breznakiella homolactica]|uniref:DUF3592 domain-containing protein n=1 Tax=Breznakiella homolactica TaxID=2798577 RepID=A0A7T7XR31_9SPIR|nr:hypothetical protein [Breznakiella homolactica]QQO10899.1 hypothetical protein JFL75_08275 [Breznakiella homolactica]
MQNRAPGYTPGKPIGSYQRIKDIIIPPVVIICIMLFFLFFDGFTILTMGWNKAEGKIVSVNVIEYPVNSKTKGTTKAYISEITVEYVINNEIVTKDIILNEKVQIGNILEIRINPNNSTLITAKKINFTFYGIIGSIFIVFIIFYIYFTFINREM